MRFGDALQYLIMGREMTMRRWEVGTFVKIVKPDQPPGGFPKLIPYLVQVTAKQEQSPYLPSNPELMAVDWILTRDDD